MMQQNLFPTKLTVRYNPYMEAVSRGDASSMPHAIHLVAMFYESDKDMTVNVANELSILAFRVLVKEKRISHDRIVFEQNGRQYHVNKDGRFIDGSMSDVAEQFLARLL